MVRAKFRCVENAKLEIGNRVKLMPVIGGSDENKEFFHLTPYGSIEIGTLNGIAALHFIPGNEYYIDFTNADESKR